ncbi:MAG: ACP S-malonyltransferase [Chloroflexi bacterium]|nr:ACP S-malonyltransferase [Chloroflexota bacterium]
MARSARSSSRAARPSSTGSRSSRSRSPSEVPRTAWLFPGQGAQTVGMGQALAEAHPEAARTFEESNDALGFDLRALCWNGPIEQLDRTINAQPALLTTSIAALRSTLAAGLPVDDPLLAGHSLGEFTALVAGGALSLPDALRLVRRRGELMQAADASGGMAAVLGVDATAVEGAIAGSGLVIANDNAPGQIVISGPLRAFAAATVALKAAGAKRVLPLRVSGAFHSPEMRAVAPDLARAIAQTPFSALRYTVIANVDAQPHEHAADFAALLEQQVYSPVRWTEIVKRAVAEGATTFIEFGAGNVLTGLVKRIAPEARTANVSDPSTLAETLALS